MGVPVLRPPEKCQTVTNKTAHPKMVARANPLHRDTEINVFQQFLSSHFWTLWDCSIDQRDFRNSTLLATFRAGTPSLEYTLFKFETTVILLLLVDKCTVVAVFGHFLLKLS